MTKLIRFSLLSVAALIGAWALTSAPVAGQSKPSMGPPLVITAYGGKTPATPYRSPKTPWGEPDLIGVWSSDDTAGIPMSRPQNCGAQPGSGVTALPANNPGGFNGRGRGGACYGDRLFLNDEEYAQRQQQITTRARQGDDAAVGAFRFDYARRAFAQTSLIVDPPNGQQPAYTPEAFARAMPRGTYGNGPLDWTTDFSTYERCITRGVLGSSLNVIYGNGQEISQSPGYVTITYEMIHDTRVIPTDGRAHVSPKIHLLLGNSVGHWEGDELVVETTNFTNQTAIGVNGNGNRHSTQLKFIERFKRVAKDVVQYQVTIDDPLTYERPWTMSYPLTPLDGGRILPYTCHEGNMALTQSLGGERAEDRALAEDLKKGIVRARRPVQDGLGVGGAPVGPGGGGLFGGRGGAPPTPGADTQEK
jgi:hypothetical protein